MLTPPAQGNASTTPRNSGRPSPFSSPSVSGSRSSPGRRKRAPEKNLAGGASPGSPDLGPFLLKLSRDTVAAGDSPRKALDYAIRAAEDFERVCAGGVDRSLELAMSLQVAAAIHCNLGRPEEAVRVLERAVRVADPSRGAGLALAAFSGHMQLGDTHSMMGRLDRSILAYESGLKIQTASLGETDPRIVETCRHLSEAYVQAMRLEEAEDLCNRMLEIHRLHSAPASLEEAGDRRLMALICEAKGDYEAALEHLVLASMSMIANGQEAEVAAIDTSIGNIYLSLSRFDESIFSYHKALTVFKSTKGDNHSSVAAVFVRLAELYLKTGRHRESRSYCENALRIYTKPMPGTAVEEISMGLTEISAISGAAGGPEEGLGLGLLERAARLLEDHPGQQRGGIVGIEAQMGVLFYLAGRFWEAWNWFQRAVSKVRASGESSSAFFGVILNQTGLACVQLYKIGEAASLFEEARGIMEVKCGAFHSDTLAVCSNLAATYDAMGRAEDAIGMLEHVLRVREEELGTASPEVEDERRRLSELLRETGRSRSRKAKSLENLLDSSHPEAPGWHSGLISGN